MQITTNDTRTAYRKLPEEVRGFVVAPETIETIAGLLNKAGLSEEQGIYADGEVFYTMLGLIHPNDAIKHIASNTGKKPQNLEGLKNDLKTYIFSHIPSEYLKTEEEKEIAQESTSLASTVPVDTPELHHSSELPEVSKEEEVEELLPPPVEEKLIEAPELLTSIPVHTAVVEVPVVTPEVIAPAASAAPTNLPTESIPEPIKSVEFSPIQPEEKKEEKPEPKQETKSEPPRYSGGVDPYREPIE